MFALPQQMRQMFNISLRNDFPSYLTAFTLVLLVSALWYFLYVYKPYAKFPACRFEYHLFNWIVKQIPLNVGILQVLIQQAKQHESEGVFAAWGGLPYLVAYGEDIVKIVLNEPSATDKPSKYKMLEYVVGKGVLTSNGEVFKKQRKMAAPAFYITALKTYVTAMNEHSEEMIKRLSGLDGHPTDDVLNIVGICAFGILDETNFGRKEKNVDEYRHLINILNLILEFTVKRLWNPLFYFDFSLKLFPSARESLLAVSTLQTKIIKPRLQEIKNYLLSRQASVEASDDALIGKRLKPIGESFVEQHLQDATITLDDISFQISAVLIAGFDTVTHTLKYALFLLGHHQDVQKRAFEEVVSETEGHVTYDDLQRLTYLECVIKETVRLFPAISIFARKLNKELQCGEYILPRNATVGIFPYMLHRNPEIYPDPEKFNPERFMDVDTKIRPWNFIPFAEGLRPCIGKNYANVQMMIVLSHVLRNFRIISLDPMEDLKKIKWSIVLACSENLRMQFVPRNIPD